MEMNQEDSHKKDDKQNKMSVLPDLNIFTGITGTKTGTSSTHDDTPIEAANEDTLFDGISESISSVKDSIVEHSGELIENTAKAVGEIAGGIADAVGDVISNIDL